MRVVGMITVDTNQNTQLQLTYSTKKAPVIKPNTRIFTVNTPITLRSRGRVSHSPMPIAPQAPNAAIATA